MSEFLHLFQTCLYDKDLLSVTKKIKAHIRITLEEGLLLFEKGELGFLGILANYVREQKHSNKTYFIRNYHIEPSNICVYKCKFCSYSRKQGEPGSWNYTQEEIIYKLTSLKGQVETSNLGVSTCTNEQDISEIHIVGSVHPEHDLEYYCNLLKLTRTILPKVHIKAFSAVELDYVINKAGLTIEQGIAHLKQAGLNSIPGGGAEIFAPEIRSQICNEKLTGERWLAIHEAVHKAGMHSNATMLYGHIENYRHRLNHLEQLRNLQDKTGMFNAFIPLKYRSKNNQLHELGEVNRLEDLKNYAVSRIFLDNFPHIKAYWPMLGKEIAQLSLSFGVDDLDGTISDSTRIYSLAGAEEQSPTMTVNEIIALIRKARRVPVERDGEYQVK